MIKRIIVFIIVMLMIPVGQGIDRNNEDFSFDTYALENIGEDETDIQSDIPGKEILPEPEPEPESEPEAEPEPEPETEPGQEIIPEVEIDDKPEIDADDEEPMVVASTGIPASINGIIDALDVSRIAIIPGTDGSTYQAYSEDVSGLQAALFELYQNGNNAEYVLYIGSDIAVPSTMCAKISPAIPVQNDISFSSLSGRVGTIAIVGSPTDPITTATMAPDDANTIDFGASLYTSSNIILRNINYSIAAIYMQGHSLTMDRGSFATLPQGMNVYGGTDNGDVSGNPVITVNSTGSGESYNFHGGNHNEGTLTGNSSIVINNTSGNISSVYGGGYGTSSVSKANVNGNVSTIINNVDGTFLTIYGGVNYGDISGSITTLVRGSGSATSATTFHGGSYSGNIGASLPSGSDAITSILDVSSYTDGSILYVGGNDESGTIYGNIKNTVTAGGYGSGGLRGFYGGGNNNTNPAIDVANSAPESRASIFAAAADFKVYGNITNEITQGCVGESFDQGMLRGAGYAGYIEGDVSTIIGTQGLCYGGDNGNENMDPSSALYTRGYNTGFDIVAGGGSPGIPDIIYIRGNTSLIQKNTFARHTSGGSFSGYIEGNTRNEFHAGIVDVVEGAGYDCQGIYGNTSAYVYGGQVDYYICGGGRDDDLIIGNVHAEVHGGMINASLGGTYGLASYHEVTGDSTVLVTGGDFSGSQRDGSNTISGGPINAGSILGNSSVTIDLRKGTDFRLPINPITGGLCYGATSKQILGTNSTNTVELNIFTGPGNDIFSNTILYGIGGDLSTHTRSGSIIINIDAPGSSIGGVYATQATNISAQEIIKNVSINIKDAKFIAEIFASSENDNYNNDIIKRSAGKQLIFNIGGSDSTGESIEIGGSGLANFTELNINKVTLIAVDSGGSIKNGRLASAAAHSKTFGEFGDITVSNGGGLGIQAGGSALISGGVLKINGDAKLLSPSGHGIVNITEFSAAEGGCLVWTRTGGDAMRSMTGSWFGKKQAYRVITFTPVKMNASAIGPDNFYGEDAITGKTFIGDNDITDEGETGYGLAIAGSVLDFKVTKGEGDIQHNVSNVSMGPAPVTVYGTPAMNVLVREGKLFIPSSGNLPTLTFIPDANFEARVKEIVILCSDGTVQTIEEFMDFESAVWSSKSNEYSYTIEAVFTSISLNEVAFYFYKVDAANTNEVLEGAIFSLYRPGDDLSETSPPDGLVTSESIALGVWTPVLNEEDLPLKVESGADGVVDFGMLPNGVYMLVEVKAPLNFAKPVGQWLIQTDSNQTGNERITITGKGTLLPPAFMRDEADNLLLLNQKPLRFPTSGSIEGLITVLVSMCPILCALILLLFRKRNSLQDTVQNRSCDFAETNK